MKNSKELTDPDSNFDLFTTDKWVKTGKAPTKKKDKEKD